MKILNVHLLFDFLSRYQTAINEAPYMPELYKTAEELLIEIQREVCDDTTSNVDRSRGVSSMDRDAPEEESPLV